MRRVCSLYGKGKELEAFRRVCNTKIPIECIYNKEEKI